MEGRTDLYRLDNGTLTAIEYIIVLFYFKLCYLLNIVLFLLKI